jgi:hypothetical protein
LMRHFRIEPERVATSLFQETIWQAESLSDARRY